MKIRLLALAISMMAVVGAPAESPPNQKPDRKSIARDFIVQLKDEKFDDAEKQFDETMRKALPASQLQAIWRAILQANGGFKRLDESRISHVANWDVVETPCVFEKSASVIRISLDKQQQIAGLFFLPSTNRDSSDKDSSEVKLETANGTLYATLDLPVSKGPWPVVLILAGSGPTDRDGNQPTMKNDSLRMVGKALAAYGVAALRCDKRGVAKSTVAGPAEDKLRFENYVDDAASWVKQLRSDHRFNAVVIAGHSEGSLVGILAAKKEPIDAFVSIAGAGRDVASLLREQLKGQMPDDLYQQSSHIIDELAAGRKVEDPPATLMMLFRPSVQPYLMSWMKYDPAKEIAGLKIPILVVQGTTDVQISLEDQKLLANGNKNARLATIDKMNHVLKSAAEKSLLSQVASYSDPSLPLAPHLMDEIFRFLDGNVRRKSASTDSR